MERLPLEGIRILDCTMWWAGPFAMERLADLGAQVIKVESIQRFDGARVLNQPPVEKGYEMAALYLGNSRNKYDITLDLTRPTGVEILKKLVKVSDVVAENYRPGVMEGFGLGYSVLKEVNPNIIMISMPGLGLTGPWKDFVAWQSPVEQMSGLPQITGYPDGPPNAVGMADPIGGLYGAIAVLMALHQRRRIGKGQYIDMSQIEGVICLIGELIMDYTMNGRVALRQGNDHPAMAPHGCYRCQDVEGEERWVTIAVTSDEEWDHLCEAMGAPPWAKDDKFADALSRWEHREELNQRLGEWTRQRTHYEVMHHLQKFGVPAGAVLTSADLLEDPQLAERDFFDVLPRPVVGTLPYPGFPIKFSGRSIKGRWASPILGQHNEEILGDILGFSKKELGQLEEEQIIGTVPLRSMF